MDITWTSDGNAHDAASVSEVSFTDCLLALLLSFDEALSIGIFVSYCIGMLDFLEKNGYVEVEVNCYIVEFGIALCNNDV
jgi:hypothetical protein